jgi:hypothetical protein
MKNLKNPSDSHKKSQPAPQAAQATAEQGNASGRWTALHRTRLPHKVGMPLSSSGGGDSGER